MADPAPTNPPEETPEAAKSRVNADLQMAALTGQSVELPKRKPHEEPVQDANTAPDRQPQTGATTTRFDDTVPSESPPKVAQPFTSDTAETPVSPPAPSQVQRSAPPNRAPAPAAETPRPPTPSSPNAQDRADQVSRTPQAAPLTAPAMIAAALTGGLRRPDPPPAPASNAADARQGTLLDRLALKGILDNLRRQEPQVSAPPKPATGAATPASAAAPNAATPASAAPAGAPTTGGIRDKLGVFTAERMQGRRDAEQINAVAQAGATALASLEAVQRVESTAILSKIHEAAKTNGGIENVLAEMRPGGAFEDLRKEFNLALSNEEGFARAYDNAAGALSGYAEARATAIASPHRPADSTLARLETLDLEIAEAAKNLPGLKDGKSALDEAFEGGKEALQKAVSAIRQTFTQDQAVRGPSPNPSFGP